MNLRYPALLAWSLTLAASLPAAAPVDLARVTPVPADQPVPLQDFFRPRLLAQPRLNPSGTHIAAIVTAGEDRHQLLVYGLADQKTEFAAGSGDKDIYDFSWLDDHRLIFNLAARKMYGLGLMAANVGRLSDGYPLLQYYGTSLIAIPPKDRLRPLVWNRFDALDTRRDLGAAVVNTDIRRGNMINLASAGADHSLAIDARDNNERHIVSTFPTPGRGLTISYLADREGALAFALTADQGVFALHRFADGQWTQCPVDLDNIDVITAGDQPGQLVVLGPRQEGQPRALQYLDAATGTLGDVLLQDKAYDFNGWIYRDPATQAIIGAMFDRNGPRTVWFNEDYRALQKVLDGFFPGLVVRIIGSNEAQNFFLVATFSDRQPVIYNWVDLAKRTAGLFKNSAPWIDPARMAPVNIIKFKTRDGRALDAYLTLPVGATKANPPPLVVLPHGGPWARDHWGFDGEAQFLASRGYAVLKPNYRGSTGINWLFPQEDEWDFAKMHHDITDATKTMIASGLIDPDRIGIMGASFGGYLAISGVVNEPGLYRCAITNAGVFDWEQQVKNSKYGQYDSPIFGRLIRKLGDPKTQPEKFAAISPGRQADRIRVPVFVAGGKDDQTVEINQSRDLIAALARNGVPHETLLVGDEGHGMGHLDNQVELYGRIEAFLAKHLMPKK
ncbi:Prolyl tripeptidyl peptidase precursor [Lacunisphaera limnophila]|uniref:Prolyl tripeptidyl peptidase n=1 Tax=Lacunisphaera limnophila TaxID=1838286 RepID=A0A1I7PHY6_9BACT|nr:prolyl oligopeptidase family serine peptidase [Lacunisphaera limnophila]AOS43236.1 Prolyl tripeptidyl peptidase precursor [Lacunisphaera limnophila]